MSFILLGILNSQAAGAAGVYDLLETVEPSGTNTVTFTGLDTLAADYKHLQIRYTMRDTRAITSSVSFLTINNDNGNNYAHHRLDGSGSVVNSSASTSQNRIQLNFFPAANETSNVYGAGVLDLLDFNSTTKNPTIRNLNGYAASTNEIALFSGFRNNTEAVDTISIFVVNVSLFAAGSRFSLYGIR